MKGLRMEAVVMIFAAFLVWAAPAAWAGQGKGGPSGPVGVPPGGPVIALPDLVVAHATVAMKCKPDGTRTATIFAIVKNQSSMAPADLSKIPFSQVLNVVWWFPSGDGYLETVKPGKSMITGAVGGPKVLKPGGVWASTFTITGIPKVANVSKLKKEHPDAHYVFKVTADPLKGVAESNEGNNEKNLGVPWDQCD